MSNQEKHDVAAQKAKSIRVKIFNHADTNLTVYVDDIPVSPNMPTVIDYEYPAESVAKTIVAFYKNPSDNNLVGNFDYTINQSIPANYTRIVLGSVTADAERYGYKIKYILSDDDGFVGDLNFSNASPSSKRELIYTNKASRSVDINIYFEKL